MAASFSTDMEKLAAMRRSCKERRSCRAAGLSPPINAIIIWSCPGTPAPIPSIMSTTPKAS